MRHAPPAPQHCSPSQTHKHVHIHKCIYIWTHPSISSGNVMLLFPLIVMSLPSFSRGPGIHSASSSSQGHTALILLWIHCQYCPAVSIPSPTVYLSPLKTKLACVERNSAIRSHVRHVLGKKKQKKNKMFILTYCVPALNPPSWASCSGLTWFELLLQSQQLSWCCSKSVGGGVDNIFNMTYINTI